MESTSEPLSATVPATSYARRKRRAGRAVSRWWYAAAGVVFLGAAALIVRATAGDWVRSLLGQQDALGTYHVVQPTTLNITLTEDGELKPCESTKMKCELEGQSTILSVVAESTRVKKGDLLVELASDQLEDRLRAKEMERDRIKGEYDAAVAEYAIQQSQNASNLKKAEIDLQVAELDLQKYLNGDFQGRLKEIDVQIKQSEMDIERKERELAENKELAVKGWVTPNEIEEREFALTVAKMQLERHRLSMQILLDYEKPKNVKQTQSAVDRAREELEREQQRAASREEKSKARVEQYEKQLSNITLDVEKLHKQLEKCKIYAPAGGIVQYPNEGPWRWESERIAAGEKAYEGQTLVVLPDTSRMLVSTRIHEADRHLVREDLPCVVTVPAVPGESFSGKITKIDKYAESESRWLNPDLKEHGAEILLDETNAPLSPGDSAEVKILIDTIENVLAVPVQCVFTRGSRSFVFARRGGEDEPVEVTLGRSNTSLIEISDGLTTADRVLMKADERLLAKLPAIGTTEVAEQELAIAQLESASAAPAADNEDDETAADEDSLPPEDAATKDTSADATDDTAEG